MQVWFFNEAGRRWEQEPSALSGHTDWVRDVAWAPNLGLPLNTIASASQVPNVGPAACPIWQRERRKAAERGGFTSTSQNLHVLHRTRSLDGLGAGRRLGAKSGAAAQT